MAVQVGVLGALQVRVGAPGSLHANLGGRRQRALLSMLLVARGEVLSVDRLIDGLWQDSPPPGAVGTLQVYVSNLRRALEPDRAPRSPSEVLRSEPPGYAVRLPRAAVDGWRFEELVTEAERAEPAAAVATLEHALGLWRGRAYAEVADEPWAEAEAARLEGLRVVARERLSVALLAADRPAEATLAADALTRDHPLREEAWRVLASALYAEGRQADALAALRSARDHLIEELGLDPGPALQQLELDILTHRMTAPAPAPAPPAPSAATREADRFVGRAEQLRALHAVAEQARADRSTTTALVIGDPGAGKSMLLQHVGEQLERAGWIVVAGRCPEAGGAPPAWAWAQVVRSLAAVHDPGAASPALAPLLVDEPMAVAQEAAYGRFVLRQALSRFLAEIATTTPLAVLIDDVQAADEETRELLATVAREVVDVPLVVVAAARSTWPGGDAADGSGALALGPAVRVHVRGFDGDDASALVAAIAGGEPDRETVQALVERTGGNALYLVESARLLQSEGSLVATSRVPDGVRDVLRRRFARLDPATVEVLRLASVIGRDVDVEVLVRAATTMEHVPAEEQAIDALDAGVRAGILIEPAPGTVRFSHVVVRETLYDDVPGVRRSRWHARVADALADVRPTDVAGRAHHLYRSGTAAGARAAVDGATAAGDQAMAQYAPEQAIERYRQALQALDRLTSSDASGTSAERVELLCRCSLAELAAGAGVAALETRSQAVRAAERAEDRDLLVRALTAWDLPTPWTIRPYGTSDPQVVGLLERCLRTELEPDIRCRLLCALVREVAGVHQDRARAASVEAEQLARDGEDVRLLGLALHGRGVALLHDSDLAARVPIGHELCRLGERPGLAVFALIGHEFLVQWAAAHADVATLTKHVVAIDALVATFRWRQAAAVVATHHALLAHLAGDLDAAEARYASVAERLRRHGGLDAQWIPLIGRFSLAVTRGRPGDLAPLLDAIGPLTPSGADFAAVVYADAGRIDVARAAHARAPAVACDFFRSLFLTVRAMAVVALDEVGEAAEVYDQLSAHAGQLGGAVTGAFALLPTDAVLGDLARLLGRHDRAAAHYAAAAAVAERCGSAPWRALMAERLAATA